MPERDLMTAHTDRSMVEHLFFCSDAKIWAGFGRFLLQPLDSWTPVIRVPQF